MKRGWVLALSAPLLLASQAFAQTVPADSRTLQSLLQEVRELRGEVESIAANEAAAQRAQILIYRSQSQDGVVARAASRLDAAKTKLAGVVVEQRDLAEQIKHFEDADAGTEDPNQRRQIENVLGTLKTRLTAIGSEEQQDQADEIDAEQQLQFEQAKLSELSSQLDRLESSLEDSGRPAVAKPQVAERPAPGRI